VALILVVVRVLIVWVVMRVVVMCVGMLLSWLVSVRRVRLAMVCVMILMCYWGISLRHVLRMVIVEGRGYGEMVVIDWRVDVWLRTDVLCRWMLALNW
jgi:hypothetical protein